MIALDYESVNTQPQTSGTILWLCGWSMPDAIFDRTRELLPDFHHLSVDYSNADSPEKMLLLTEIAVKKFLNVDGEACRTRAFNGPLLIGGWSLGGLLALRLAIKGFADGLVLFGTNARFTR